MHSNRQKSLSCCCLNWVSSLQFHLSVHCFTQFFCHSAPLQFSSAQLIFPNLWFFLLPPTLWVLSFCKSNALFWRWANTLNRDCTNSHKRVCKSGNFKVPLLSVPPHWESPGSERRFNGIHRVGFTVAQSPVTTRRILPPPPPPHTSTTVIWNCPLWQKKQQKKKLKRVAKAHTAFLLRIN